MTEERITREELVMFFLAESHNTGDSTPYLQAEGARMRELQQAGIVETVFLKADRSGAIILLRAADAAAAAAGMHTDVVFTDMALRTEVIGRIETVRYLERVLGRVPYGQGSALRHVVGGAGGGGFEWTAGPGAGQLVGITALELGEDGLITAITTVYDSRQIDPAAKRALLEASFA